MDKKMSDVIPGELYEATSNLVKNLGTSETFLRHKQAYQSLQANTEAMALISEFSELQSKLRSHSNLSSDTEKVIQRLRDLQGEIMTNDSIQEKELAEEYAVAFVREINQEISDLLGFDFATFARRASGCC